MAKNRRHDRSSFGHSSFLRASSFGFRHCFIIRHFTPFLFALIRVIRGQSNKNHAPFFGFAASAALIAARRPSGFLSFPSSGWLLMNSVGVTFTPRESPRA